MGRKIINTALFISGGGTTAEAVIKAAQKGDLPHLRISAVISSNASAQGVGKAARLGILTYIIIPRDFTSHEAFGKALLQLLQKTGIELISQNGWLPLTPEKVVQSYKNRIINQHPGPLDPGSEDFGGKSMYGSRVTCARIIFAALAGRAHRWTEATTHFVTEKYDKGELLSTRHLKLSTLPSIVSEEQIKPLAHSFIEMTKTVQARLLPLEHANVVAALKLFQNGTPSSFVRKSPLISSQDLSHLKTAKLWAIRLFPHG